MELVSQQSVFQAYIKGMMGINVNKGERKPENFSGNIRSEIEGWNVYSPDDTVP